MLGLKDWQRAIFCILLANHKLYNIIKVNMIIDWPWFTSLSVSDLTEDHTAGEFHKAGNIG